MEEPVGKREQPEHPAETDELGLAEEFTRRSDAEREHQKDERPISRRMRDELDRIGSQALVEAAPHQPPQRNEAQHEDGDFDPFACEQ